MGDPPSIIVSRVGIATVCMQAADITARFIAGVKNIDENVRDFRSEVRNLASITDGVKLQLEKPGWASAMQSIGTAKEGDANLWNCISRTLQDCETQLTNSDQGCRVWTWTRGRFCALSLLLSS
jgi:hypothetical protein